MCRARLVSLLVLFIALGFTVPVQAGVEDEIKKLSAAYDKAIQTKNQVTLELFLAEDGHFVDYDGSLHTKQQHVESYLDRKFKWESVTSTDRKIRVLSDTAATETGTFDATGTMDGQPFHMRDRYIDVWSKVDGRWVVVAEFATRIMEKHENDHEGLNPKKAEVRQN
jgi:ketosteroid isomerase-like protein